MERPDFSSIPTGFGVAADPLWDISGSSLTPHDIEAPSLSGAYPNYETKDELVGGPTCLQMPVAAFVAFVPVQENADVTNEPSSTNNVGSENTDAALQELQAELGRHMEPQHPEWAALPHFTIDNCGQLVTPSTEDEQIWEPMPDARASPLNKEIKYTCKTCHIEFKSLSDFRAHKLTHTEKPYECRICYKKFSLAENLEEHKQRHKQVQYRCDECQKVFTRFSNLKFHKMIHAGEKPFSCSICRIQFKRSGHLREHLNSHLGDKPFACDLCDKKFSRLNHLKEHKLLHDGHKPFVCDVCNKPFARAGTLNKHKRLHIDNEGRQKTGRFPCEICPKEFTRKVLRDWHQKTHE